MTNDELDAAVAAKPYPKVTPQRIDAIIDTEKYFQHETLTICVLTLANGFKVTGESACVDPRNFDEEIGRGYAKKAAMQKIWPLEGYLLAEQQLQEKLDTVTAKHEISKLDRYARLSTYHKIDAIAKVCHEANRAYCTAMGDTSQPAWELAPEWQRVSARVGVDLHMSGDFGPEASHISWMQQKLAEGWEYGPEKLPEVKRHPCMVPYDQLPREQQAKDHISRAIVRALR